MATMGRPRRFDRDQAIEEAMYLFWEYGYESTSLAQLKAGLGGGISAPSFYAAFESKEALFKACCDRYLASFAQVTACLWDAELEPRIAIETALLRSARMQTERGHPSGCMVGLGALSAVRPEHAALVEPLTRSRARTRAGLLACVQRGIKQGTLAPDTSARALAMVFDSFLLGLSLLARDGIGYAAMKAAIGQVMRQWDSAAPAR